ncbi:MAG TPA: tRNA guanosine(15) transglycosylase TgtA [Candidatus Nitrosotalea sp.]|nr:tRNA guanosine(15) transglycosylase TgtA [Candidatus Nitrosotalea sp.]
MKLFEIKKSDLAARIGILHTNHGKVETPAYVPVIHPVRQSIPAKKLREMGFDLVITNAYITLKQHGEEATRKGIHGIIDYDGAVMTDSGGYQVLEYGDIDVDYKKMSDFEKGIATDFAIPLDRPTGFGLPKKKAADYVAHTLKVSKETLDARADNGQIWIGPIQGSEYSDLVKRSTRALVSYGFPMLALGSPVEFMESYEYRLLARMIITAKKEIPDSVPLHLFGAGHPLTIPLAVALGCDTFDSASYMLYAKHDRYITEDGTSHLGEIAYFSCTCEVCTRFKPGELLALPREDKINKVALHNLYSIKAEVDRVKQAIHEGRLWEYAMKKARAHPKLHETIPVLAANTQFLADGTPRFKESAIFLFSPEDQFRPEVARFHETVRKFRTAKKNLVIIPDGAMKPFYLSSEYSTVKKMFAKILEDTQFCQFNPYLGIIPLEISDVYPAAHYVASDSAHAPEEFTEFAKTWNLFLKNNKFRAIHAADGDFIRHHAKASRKKVKFFKFTARSSGRARPNGRKKQQRRRKTN